jgi:uncharacterized membrane protein
MSEYKGQTSITIQAPIETVYNYLADFSKHCEWAENIKSVTQIEAGPVRVGTRFKTAEGPPPVGLLKKMGMMLHFMRGVAGGAKTYSVAKITALEPPVRIGWEAGIPRGDDFFNFVEWEFILESEGSSTHLTQRFNWQPQNPTAEQMVKAAGMSGLEQAVGKSLRQLKEHLEQKRTQQGKAERVDATV